MKNNGRLSRLLSVVVSLVLPLLWIGCSNSGDNGHQIIIDNRDSGCVIVDGSWDLAPSTNGNGSWGDDFLYHSADRVHVGRVRFFPELTVTAPYAISIYWSASRFRTTAQPVIVHDANGNNTTYSVNLQQNGNLWFPLGSHDLGAGSYVEFNTNTAAAGYCNADAVRFVK